jgi:hypothetical protein
MDTTELDRLEQSIRRAMERIGSLEANNRQLAEEKSRLEQRVKTRLAPVTRIDPPVVISAERVAEVKARLLRLIESVKDYERQL